MRTKVKGDPPEGETLGRRDANAKATRDAILEAGRAAFAASGFTAAALDDIVRSARVTTGAVYHHFGNKKGLFQAVAESLEQEIVDAIAAALTPDMTPWQALEHGLDETLELCARPDVRRILFSDAPNVIGLREWRAIELRYGFGLMRQLLEQLEASGEIRTGSVDLTAQIMLGAVIEAVHAIAERSDTARATEEARATLLTFLNSLRRDPASGGGAR